MNFNEKNTIFLNEVESTNNYAMRLVSDKADEGTVVLAQFQSKGRGQSGNYWESEAGKNLLMSLILHPSFLEASSQFLISKIVSLSLVEVLEEYVSDVSVKWPNDIYIGNKKIAGILIETIIKGSVLESAIVGVGLNLNQEKFSSYPSNPVSLKQLIGTDICIKDFLEKFFKSFDLWYSMLKNNHKKIDEAYLSFLFRKNGWHLYRANNKKFEAQIVGIGEYGQLILKKKTGEISKNMFKEVEFIIN